MKNIIVIPFHDWRKIKKEGFRTRDSHFIESFVGMKNVKTIVINRPITLLEIFVTKKRRKISGEILLAEKGFSLLKVDLSTYVIDFVSKDVFGHFFEKHKWYFRKYADNDYVNFINRSLNKLNIKDAYLLSQNIFANQLVEKLETKKKVFDAWDNFSKFQNYSKINNYIIEAYKSYQEICDFWITNSKQNVLDFNSEFGVEKNILIKNGVDPERFSNPTSKIPIDLAKIKRPIIGFGGKITHLLDVDLLNKLILKNPDKSFVIIGQKLNKKVFNKIKKKHNFFYLGDKPYYEYSNYVKNFDICIVPYIVDKQKQTGANTIKVYEYIATGKRVVGTNSNGLEDLNSFVFIAKDANEFSGFLNESTPKYKNKIDFNKHKWNYKAKLLIDLIFNDTLE